MISFTSFTTMIYAWYNHSARDSKGGRKWNWQEKQDGTIMNISELTAYTWVCHIKQHEMCTNVFIWVAEDSLAAHRPTRPPLTLPLVQMFRPPLLLWQTFSNRVKLQLVQQKGFMALCVGPTIWLWLWSTVHHLLVAAKKFPFHFL